MQDNKATATDGNDAIATAVRNQLSLVASFDRWLDQRTAADGAPTAIVARVQRRLGSYRRWLLQAEKAPGDMSEDPEIWDMDARVRSGSEGRSTVVVNGPGLGEPIEVAAKDEKELGDLMSDNCLGYMIKICRAFAKSQDTLRSLLRLVTEMEEEESHLSQPPEATVKAYIRRLQEYNDIKDIGQQLIGLIAENRGLPVRTLYEKGEYGVSFPS